MRSESNIEAMLRDEAQGAAAEEQTAAFAARADEAGLVEVAYGMLDTPVGRMLVAATERGLVRVVLPRESADSALAGMAAGISPRILELPRRVDAARRELDEYFAGRRREFDLELDRRLIGGPFSGRVLEETSQVPYGSAPPGSHPIHFDIQAVGADAQVQEKSVFLVPR